MCKEKITGLAFEKKPGNLTRIIFFQVIEHASWRNLYTQVCMAPRHTAL
jgi:hypothetical protein